MFIDKIKKRLEGEEGFTLIELLIVLLILGILVAIAVPSYIGFRQKAQMAAAQANVRTAIPAAEAYYQDSVNNTYVNSYRALSGAKLRVEAPGIPTSTTAGYNATYDGYCIQDVEGSYTYSYTGGNGGTAAIASGACNTTTYTMA